MVLQWYLQNMDERNQKRQTHTQKEKPERSLMVKDYKDFYCKIAQSKTRYKLEAILICTVMAIYSTL